MDGDKSSATVSATVQKVVMQRTQTVDADQMKSAKHARVNHFVNGPHGLPRDHAQSPAVAVWSQGNEHARKRTLKTTSAQLLKMSKKVVRENSRKNHHAQSVSLLVSYYL